LLLVGWSSIYGRKAACSSREAVFMFRQHWISSTLDIVNYDVRLRDNYDGRRTFQLSRTTIS
jgi:hypothetical protein